jgi:hypothetical protein
MLCSAFNYAAGTSTTSMVGRGLSASRTMLGCPAPPPGDENEHAAKSKSAAAMTAL